MVARQITLLRFELGQPLVNHLDLRQALAVRTDFPNVNKQFACAMPFYMAIS